jgi:hypothetical protein
MKALGQIRETLFLEGIAEGAQQQGDGSQTLLAIDDAERGLIVIHHEISDEILRIVFLDGIVSEIFYVRPVPRVWSLKAWYAVERLF